MIISQLPELFVQRERALLGPRFDAMFSYPGQGAVRGASVNALRCTPQQFAALADFPLEASPFCAPASGPDPAVPWPAEPVHTSWQTEPERCSSVFPCQP